MEMPFWNHLMEQSPARAVMAEQKTIDLLEWKRPTWV